MRRRHSSNDRRHFGCAGLSLVELMIGMAVGLIAMLVITQILVISEGGNRGTSGRSDAVQTGAITATYLTLNLQEAGAGLMRYEGAAGCRLRVPVGGAQVVPPPSSRPAPFGSVPTPLQVAPVLAFDGGNDSDVLFVAGADSSASNREYAYTAGPDGTSLIVEPAAVAFSAGDRLLALPREGLAGSAPDCQLARIATSFTNGGTQTDALLNTAANGPAATTVPLESASHGLLDSAYVSPVLLDLGTGDFYLLGVSDQQELVRHDLFAPPASARTTIGERVFRLKVLLGVGTPPVNVWRFDFTGSGNFPAPTLMATLKDAFNLAQPITTAPQVGYDPNDSSLRRWVFVGTRRYLDHDDVINSQVQTLYALRDGSKSMVFGSRNPFPGGLHHPIDRSRLVRQTYSTIVADGASPTVAQPLGWYLDLSGSSTPAPAGCPPSAWCGPW